MTASLWATSRFAGLGALAMLGAAAVPLSAQGLRGTATSTARYIEIRPLRLDTVPRDSVMVLPDGRFTFDGQPVTCASAESCTRYVSGDVEHAVVLTQDVGFAAWGLGMRGLSASLSLRARATPGGELVWPRSNDEFDLMHAYAELNRERYRVRLGRQRTSGGLGFSGFDGASVLYEPVRWMAVEAYGGRSLARGLYEPRNEALRAIEDFVPDRDAYLIGAAAEAQPLTSTRVALRYQREIWSNRSALLSERASLDITSDAIRPVQLDGSADYDFAFGRIGKAHLTARTTFPAPALSLEATARRYVPYFELWTIWGYFSPVAHHEAELRARYSPRPFAALSAFAGYRKYAGASTTVIIRPLEDDAVRLGAAGHFDLRTGLTLDGSYTMERGFGAFLSSGDVVVSWAVAPRVTASVDGSAFQQIEEFRVGEGVVVGGGGAIDVAWGERNGIAAGVDVYRQTFDNRPGQANWNQLRAWAALRVGFGRDAGRREPLER